MGCCQSDDTSGKRRANAATKNKHGVAVDPTSQYEPNYKHPKNMNDDEYQSVLRERAEAYDKRLNAQKMKNIGKESQIEMQFKQNNLKKAEELAKTTDGKFTMQYKM